MKNSNTLFKPNFSTYILALIAALAVALLLLGCTKKSTNENTLRVPMIADAKTLDPALVADLYSHYAVGLVYEGLFEYHYLKRPYELQPLLAESMPEISKDGLTYTIKIKPGVKFADDKAFPEGKGREVKAKDFVYSWLRIADPKGGSENFWLFDNQIAGLNEWREKQKSAAKTDFDNPPEGFKAVDDYTIQIKLKRKYPQLLFALAMPAGAVVAREVVEKLGPDFVNNPVGTGPYKLESWLRNSRITFVRNPSWRGQTYPTEGEAGDAEKGLLADAGKPIPFADKVELAVFVESQPQWLNFLSGATDYSSIPKDNFKSAVDEKTKELVPELASKGVKLFKHSDLDVTYIAFNMEDPVIKKAGPNLRKAIALAIDNETLIQLFYNGRGRPAHSPVPPGIAGYDENFVNPYSAYNVEKAKEYLAKAGYPEGKGLPELTYEVSQGTDARQQAEKIQKDLAAVGIKIKIQANQFAELTEKINKKKAQMWGIAWIADYPDAENFLQLLYGPNSAPGPNGSNFNHPEFNKLFEQMKGMSDSPERRKIINRMKDIFAEQLPWVPNLHRMIFTVQQPWTYNYKGGHMGGTTPKYIRVDLEARKKGLK